MCVWGGVISSLRPVGWGRRIPCVPGQPPGAGRAGGPSGNLQPLPTCRLIRRLLGPPSGKPVMSSPSPNNRAFHGGTITIKTVCQACHARTHTLVRRADLKAGGERARREHAVSSRHRWPENRAGEWRAGLRRGRSPDSSLSWTLPSTSPGAPHPQPQGQPPNPPCTEPYSAAEVRAGVSRCTTPGGTVRRQIERGAPDGVRSTGVPRLRPAE